ncbi:SdiA-regulated domain-containing protein [Azorhizophilus paspali]|uniref:SdiA-regulated domain-containing protein n=1 Tax=Azorhizophilus paspali TaxID=69963 RepID=A0ABV6SQW2_AZOPA
MIATAKGLLGRLPTIRLGIWSSLLLGLLLVQQVHDRHLDERLYFWAKSLWLGACAKGLDFCLPDYEVRLEALPVVGVRNNLSGLTYDSTRKHLWAVINNPEELIALSTGGEVLARYPLHGFKDVEGVAYLGGDLLLLTEEREQALVAVPVPGAPGALKRRDYRSLTLGLDNPDGDNRGFEGVAYDRDGDRLFVVTEHSPLKLYEIRGFKASLAGDFNLRVLDRSDWLHDGFFGTGGTSLASLEYDEDSDHLILLSDESRLLAEVDGQGDTVSLRSLWRNSAGLKENVPQGEGLALDEKGRLYMISEPNLFYVFERED